MTISNGSAILQSDLITQCNNGRTNYNLRRTTSADFAVDVVRLGLTSASDDSVRSEIWTPQSNLELLAVRVTAEGATASDVHTFTLSVFGSGPEYLLDKTPSASLTSAGASREHAATDYSVTTGDRFILKRGVPFLLTLATTSAGVNFLQGSLVVRSRRLRE